jgi:ribosomal protein S18 acetylase RimI-like enzyme
VTEPLRNRRDASGRPHGAPSAPSRVCALGAQDAAAYGRSIGSVRRARMTLTFREAQPRDIADMFELRARTRENPISPEDLALLGITPESSAASIASGSTSCWVCLNDASLVGFSSGDHATGEILVVAVSPDFEGEGIGKRLLNSVVESLQSRGCARLWLAASPDPGLRSHGFYRHLGWQPTGQMNANGDEILECTPNQRVERACG